MELKQLQSFCAVVKYRSFTKAAEKLYLSQPTISTHVRQLEEEFQTSLIIRTTKSVEVTPRGQELYECACNIDVSKFGARVSGAGGFIDITQSTKNVVFCGTFTAGGLKTAAENGKLVIVQEGRTAKLVEQVQQITFNGPYAAKCGQHVLYITERAVFELRPEGMTLIEIAPGIDLQTQVLDHMGFVPRIADDLKLMDERIFRDELMGLSSRG